MVKRMYGAHQAAFLYCPCRRNVIGPLSGLGDRPCLNIIMYVHVYPSSSPIFIYYWWIWVSVDDLVLHWSYTGLSYSHTTKYRAVVCKYLVIVYYYGIHKYFCWHINLVLEWPSNLPLSYRVDGNGFSEWGWVSPDWTVQNTQLWTWYIRMGPQAVANWFL